MWDPPLQMPGLWAWLSAPQLTGLSDGDPVSTFTDISGLGHSPTAAGTARALYKINIKNSFPALLYDGVNDSHRLTISSVTQPITIFVAAQLNDLAGGDRGCVGYGFGAGLEIIFGFQGANSRWKSSTAASNIFDANSSGDTNWDVHTVQVNGASSFHRKNGTQTASGTLSAGTGATEFDVGVDAGAAAFWSGYIGEVVTCIGGTPPTLTQIQLMESYLTARWR